jgi:hypothetical protein
MGIGVETSMTIRARAAMAAGAVQDEARQDQGHAGDPDHVGKVLGAEAGMGFMRGGLKVDHHVQPATDGHDQQAEEHQRRQSPKRLQSLYH